MNRLGMLLSKLGGYKKRGFNFAVVEKVEYFLATLVAMLLIFFFRQTKILWRVPKFGVNRQTDLFAGHEIS